MRDFNELGREIKDKFMDDVLIELIGKATITEGHWNSDKETFTTVGDKNCYYIKIEKSFKEGNLIKTISQFSEIDKKKSDVKTELIEILKKFKNHGCEIHLSQSSSTYKIGFDIYIIRTDDLDEWYVPFRGWFDKTSEISYISPRYYCNNNELSRLKNEGWLIRTGEEVYRDKGGYKDPGKWYNRVWVDRVNVGFYYVTLDKSELVPDKWGYIKTPKIAFVKLADDYFLCFFNISHVSNSYSIPDCLVGGKQVYKCDQIDGLIKCIKDYQF